MKKNYFYAAMAGFGLLAFSSCSSDDNSLVGPNPEELTGEQVIVLDMQDTDVLSTKSRPLYSTTSKGAEEVTHVKLFIFKVNDDKTKSVLKTIDIPNWDQIATEYDYGRKYSIRLAKGDRLEFGEGEGQIASNGTIEIVAVGQNEKDLTPKPFVWGDNNLTLSGDWSNAYKGKSWNSSGTPGEGFAPLFTKAVGSTSFEKVSEIFSGTSETTPIALDGGFAAKVLLKRQVAGVLGYFDNIPAKVGESHVKYVRLVASQRNTQLDLTTLLGDQNDDVENNKKDIESVVNGFTPATTADAKTNANTGQDNDAYIVYTVDLSKWFTGFTDGTGWAAESFDANNGNVLKAEKWVNAFDPSNKWPVVKSGAVLAGEFTIPFDRVNGKNTFELQLVKADNTVLKSWNVKLDKNSQKEGDGELVYRIYRNHLYQIGQRGDGDSPENPGVDPDKPQPLNKDQDLIIKINDQWEFIHDMEIE